MNSKKIINWERDPNKINNIGTDIKKAKYYRNNLNIALEEGLDEFKKTSKNIIINGKQWKVHSNLNLYIDCITLCPCNCDFCIAKTTDNRNGVIKIEDLSKNLKILNDHNIKYTCQITGGEPTFHPKLNKIKQLCGDRKTVINTNFPSKNISTFDHINISCHHYNSKIEEEIIKYKRDRIILKQNITNIKNKIRLQCNLIGGYIDTFGEIMQYIAWGYHYLGINNYAFSFLTALPKDNLYQQSIINYVKSKPSIGFNDFIGEIEKREHWKFLKYRGGVACYYEVWQYTAYEHPITIVFKYSNNYILHELDKDDIYIPDIIIHPNGKMTASWNQNIKEIK